MKVVIDIPEARYKDIQRIAEVQLERNHFKTAEQIIAKGMPIEQEPKTEWIPVNKELPVTNDEVLVTYIVNGNHKKRFVETANCYDGEWCSVNDEYRIPFIKVEIIAWQPLPKPYKEG